MKATPKAMLVPSARRGSRLPLTAILLAGLASLTAACSTVGTSDVDPADFDYRVRHPIMISEEPEVLTLPVGMNGPAVSPQIERAVRNYVGGYRQDGTGAVTIQVPTASANEIAAAKTGQALHYALVRAGVPRSQIQVAPYHVGDSSKVAPVRLAYLRVKAATPKCGLWPETGPNTFNNAQYHNFGCATQQNLAAMVANPADLVRPEALTPASGKRRAKVILDYGDGKDPKSEIDLIEAGLDE